MKLINPYDLWGLLGHFAIFGWFVYLHWNFDSHVQEGIFNRATVEFSVKENGTLVSQVGILLDDKFFPVSNIRDGKSDQLVKKNTKVFLYHYPSSEEWFCSAKKLSFDELQSFDRNWNLGLLFFVGVGIILLEIMHGNLKERK